MANIISFKTEAQFRTIVIQIKSVYGNETIYPVSENGILLAEFKGQKTFTRRDIETLKKLGYSFTVEQQSL